MRLCGWTRNETLRVLNGNGVVAHSGSIGIGQTTQFVDANQGDETDDRITDANINTTVPLHAAHGGHQHGISTDGREAFDMIFRTLLYTHEGTDGCLNIAVARRLSTPRTSIDDRATILNAHNGIVVVHKVAAGKRVEPHASVGALSGSARCNHEVAYPILANDAGMDEEGLLGGETEGVGHHHRIVESVAALMGR